MAHDAQRLFFERVKEANPEFFHGGKILEVGSLNINGTVRDFFDEPEEYIGIDIGPGPGVDRVVGGQDADYPDNYFDVTVSAECFEHNPYWKETFVNMIRMTRLGGLAVFTCAGEGRPEHGTSRTDVGSSPLTVGIGWDYYRNLEAGDFREFFPGVFGSQYQFYYEPYAKDLYFVGSAGGTLFTPSTLHTHMEPVYV